MKFNLEQVVWYMLDNRVHSAKVTSRTIVENVHENWNSTAVQRAAWQPFGNSGIRYGTTHGQFSENQIFGTKEELLQSL